MQAMLKEQFADLPAEYHKDIPDFTEVHRLNPTPECPSGTQGRVACFEVFDMSIDLERAILASKPEDELFSIVRKQGMLTMKEDAMIKSAQGTVPFEEVNTLGGEFDLEEEPVVVAPPPAALSEEGALDAKEAEAAPAAPAKEVQV